MEKIMNTVKSKEKLLIEKMTVVDYKNEPIKNGAWVYKSTENELITEWYKTIGDAIKAAIKFDYALVISNGKEIHYDVLDDNRAYYISGDKAVVLNL